MVELVGAYLASSLALLADAGHLATDAAAVVLALGASYVAARPGGPRSTFGYHRAEILAAMANAIVLLVVCGYLAWAGVNRLRSPDVVEVEAGLLIAFAAVGLLANAVSLLVLRRLRDRLAQPARRSARGDRRPGRLGPGSRGGRGDRGQRLGAGRRPGLVADRGADPAAVVVAAEGVVVGAARDRPRGLDLDAVRRHVAAMPGVIEVHDLHAWTITSGIPSLSAHVTVTDEALAEHGVGGILDRLCDCVATHFDVRHATFQIEPQSHRAHEDLGDLHA